MLESLQTVSRFTHRSSSFGVLVLRLGWEGNRMVRPEKGRLRVPAQSGHSTRDIPVFFICSGEISTIPLNEHVELGGSAGDVSPTGGKCPTN